MGAMGSMGPEVCPNVIIIPRVRKQSRGAQECILNHRIEDHRHFLAAGDTGNLRYEILFRIENRVVTAMGTGQFRLSFRRNGADDRCAERGRPLAENEAHAAGRGMYEDQVTRHDGIHLPDEHLSGHTLQHHRGCLIEGDRLWQFTSRSACISRVSEYPPMGPA
jgi:hypothetical protein